jgi:hypothetical protein
MAYFTSKAATGGAKSDANDGHSYIISLLEEVLLTLQPRSAISAGSSADQPEAKPSINDTMGLENYFAALEVEDPVNVDDGALQLPSAQPSKPAYELESPKSKEDIQEEKLFAIFCLFDDLARIRAFLARLWTDTKEDPVTKIRKVDFVTASVITNTAWQLAIRTQDEILVAYSDCMYHFRVSLP